MLCFPETAFGQVGIEEDKRVHHASLLPGQVLPFRKV